MEPVSLMERLITSVQLCSMKESPEILAGFIPEEIRAVIRREALQEAEALKMSCNLCQTKCKLINELKKTLASERRHHASQRLKASDVRMKAEDNLVRTAREWAKNWDAWDAENENRAFRQIRYAAEKVIRDHARES